MKKLYLLILAFFWIPCFLPFFSYVSAQSNQQTCWSNPPVCSATPQSMNLYLDFQDELATLLKTNKFETATIAVSQWEWGIFSNELLELEKLQNFDDSLAGQALKIFYVTSARSATALITSAFLFELSALSTLADNTVSLTILFHDRPIVRDWAKLLNIERTLNQTAYYLGEAWDITKTIANTDQIQLLMKKYEEKGLLQKSESFPSSIKYTALISSAVSLNIVLKAFLAYGSIQPLENWKFGWSSIVFSTGRIQQLKTDYQCTRWNAGFKCNKPWKHLSQNLKTLVNSVENQGKWSRNQISQSWKELVQAIGTFPGGALANLKGKSSDSYLTEREKILLRNIYGLDTTRMTKDEALSIISLSKTTKNQWKSTTKEFNKSWETIKNAGKDVWKFIKKVGNSIKELIKNIGKKAEKNTPEWQIKKESRAEKFEDTLRKNLEVVMLLKLQADTVSDTSTNISLTQQFWELSVLTQKLLDTIGSKDKNLRKTLNSVCSYQCSNKGIPTCYIQ